MPAETTPHMTSVRAAEVLGVTPTEIRAMAEDGTLDSFVLDGRLRVSQLSVERLWFERGVEQLRAEGIR